MFLTGVIEGFYGRAWTFEQRIRMLEWIAAAEMNTYVYAPKDDIKVRARWREIYSFNELDLIEGVVKQSALRNLEFMAAIAPCLDVTYSDPAELTALVRRIDQLVRIGISNFALLFDDIPSSMQEVDAKAFPSFAAAQAHLANGVLKHLRARGMMARLFFCPTEYCARFANNDVPGSAYLNELGRLLDPEIEVFWTGPEIVSETISADSLREVGAVLRRKPVIWENFHANDYDIRRIHAGPLAGRSTDILPLIAGYITNPNKEFDANFVAVRTAGAFVSGEGYDPTAAFGTAIAAWRPNFQLAYRPRGETLSLADLSLLAQLFYQPFAEGPEIAATLARARAMLSETRPDTTSADWQAGLAELKALRANIIALFERMTELEDRDLFYAFHPYLWEAREEVTHLVAYLEWLAENPAANEPFPHADRIHNFYRRGFTVAVQQMFPRNRQGYFFHVP